MANSSDTEALTRLPSQGCRGLRGAARAREEYVLTKIEWIDFAREIEAAMRAVPAAIARWLKNIKKF